MDSKRVLAWAFYDWANSAFATSVMAAFFPIFFSQYWSVGVAPAESTFRLGLANSLASIAVVALAPVLGAIADRGGTRKRFLFTFALLGILTTSSLYLVARGEWSLAALFFVLAILGFSGANIFYDALLVSVAGPGKLDLVSALGYALGYLGGGLLFVLNVCMVLWPAAFGLADQSAAVRASFLSVGIWWALFAIPLFLFVPEPQVENPVGGLAAISAGLRQLVDTFRRLRQQRMAFLFLVGYWFYIDGVDTIIRMAVNYGERLGFGLNHLLVALGITQFVGFPAAIAFGKIGERVGPRAGLFIGIGVYIGVAIWGFFLDRVAEFYGLAIAIGLVQGGVQSLSRSLYARLIPTEQAAEFFGFYNMLGKFAAVLGPFLMGWIGRATGNPRYSLLSIIALFAIGGFLLVFVRGDCLPPKALEE